MEEKEEEERYDTMTTRVESRRRWKYQRVYEFTTTKLILSICSCMYTVGPATGDAIRKPLWEADTELIFADIKLGSRGSHVPRSHSALSPGRER